MQAESDIFLGWTRVPGPDQVERDFYVRQLKDWKFSAPVELAVPSGLMVYAGLCGWTLARAHARSGDRVAGTTGQGGARRRPRRRPAGYRRPRPGQPVRSSNLRLLAAMVMRGWQ